MALSLTPHSAPSLARPSLPAWSTPSCDGEHRRWSPWHRRARGPSPLLAGIEPFDRYPAKVVGHLSRHADRLRLPEGAVVAEQGHRAREVVVVLAGRVQAQPGEVGDADIAADAERAATTGPSYGPGSWVGTHEALTGRPHGHTLVAGADVDVVVLNGPAYRWAAGNLPGLADDTA